MIDGGAPGGARQPGAGSAAQGLSARGMGQAVHDYLGTGPTLDRMSTPSLTVDRAALQSNVAVMADWARSAGVQLAPHGKTTMAPQVWARQLNAGAWGITLATPWQVQLARSFGVARILLANTIVDPVALVWLAAELHADPSFEFFIWADSVRTVELMDHALKSTGQERPVNVIVELGGPGGRSGARSSETARAVAAAIHRSTRLTLAGIGGYEGVLSDDREPTGLVGFSTLSPHSSCQGEFVSCPDGATSNDAIPHWTAEPLAGYVSSVARVPPCSTHSPSGAGAGDVGAFGVLALGWSGSPRNWRVTLIYEEHLTSMLGAITL